jgi:hypothetical protein
MAELGGFGSSASARTGWHNIRKKLGIGECILIQIGHLTIADTPTELSTGKTNGGDGAKTPTKAGGKRKNRDAEDEADDGESTATTPKKLKSAKKGNATKTEDEDEGEEAESNATTPKKEGGRKPKATKTEDEGDGSKADEEVKPKKSK